MKHRSSIFGANGFASVSDPISPHFGDNISVASDKDDVAVVGELRWGTVLQFGRRWSATMGYRVVGMSGVALSTNQVPVDFIAALDSLVSVDSNAHVILHGGFAGVEMNY